MLNIRSAVMVIWQHQLLQLGSQMLSCVYLCQILVAASAQPPSDEQTCFTPTIYSLKTAECDHKTLKVVPSSLDRDIKVLEMSENHLTVLDIDAFKLYSSLQEIKLVRNRIDEIAPDAFRGLHSLQILELEGNRLEAIPEEAFRHIPSLRILTLKSNQIRYITQSAFRFLPNIEELNFQNCYLERIDPRAFQSLSRLNELNLVNNELRTLSPEMRNHLPASLSVVRLYQNPWVCDCQLRWLRHWVSQGKINWHFNQNTPVCSDPELFREIAWKMLSEDKFACPAKIVSNSSTTIELQLGANVTIHCLVSGDPEPKVTWQKAGQYISKENVLEAGYDEEGSELRHIRSSLVLTYVTLDDMADYKCIASNTAGHAETTYKVWVNTPQPTGGPVVDVRMVFGLSKLAIIALSAGGGGLVLIAVITILCFLCCRRHQRRRRAYQVRGAEYKKQLQQKQKMEAMKKEECGGEEGDDEKKPVIKKEKPRYVPSPTVEGNTDLLLAKEVANHVPQTTLPRPTSMVHNDLHVTKIDQDTSEFKMKIFTSYKDTGTVSPDGDSGGLALGDKTGSPENTLREATPDLLCDEKHTRTLSPKSPTPPPPPAAYFANHLASNAPPKRAKENPYVKPSELKSGARTPEGMLEHSFLPQEGSLSSPRLATKERRMIISPGLQRSGHKDTTCTNPVCMAVHEKETAPHSITSPSPQQKHISVSQSVGSMSDLDLIDSALHKVTSRDEDRYQTLPCRQSLPAKGALSSARKLPLVPSNTLAGRSPSSTSPQHLERPSKHRVQFASPVRESPPAERQWSSPTSSHSSTSSAGNPLHPTGLKVMSPEGPKTLTFPGALDVLTSPAPARQSTPRIYGCSTSIDDLLSPPFQTFSSPTSESGRKTKAGQTIPPPKPGEKDDFGTAV